MDFDLSDDSGDDITELTTVKHPRRKREPTKKASKSRSSRPKSAKPKSSAASTAAATITADDEGPSEFGGDEEMQELLRQGAKLLAGGNDAKGPNTEAPATENGDHHSSPRPGSIDGPSGAVAAESSAAATAAKDAAAASAAALGMSKKRSFDLNAPSTTADETDADGAGSSARPLSESETAMSSAPELDAVPEPSGTDMPPPDEADALSPSDSAKDGDDDGFVVEDDDEEISAVPAEPATRSPAPVDEVVDNDGDVDDDEYGSADSFLSEAGKPEPSSKTPAPSAAKEAAVVNSSPQEPAAKSAKPFSGPVLPSPAPWGGGKWDETASTVAAGRGGALRSDAFETLLRTSRAQAARAGDASGAGRTTRRSTAHGGRARQKPSRSSPKDAFQEAIRSEAGGAKRSSKPPTGGDDDEVVVRAGARPLCGWRATLAGSTHAGGGGGGGARGPGGRSISRKGPGKAGVDESWFAWLDGLASPADRSNAAVRAGVEEFSFQPHFSASSRRLMDKVSATSEGDVVARNEAFVERQEARRVAELHEDERRARIIAKRSGQRAPPQWSRAAKGFFERQEAFLRRKEEGAARAAEELTRETRRDTRKRWDEEAGAIVEEEAARAVWDAETREAFFARQQEAIDRLEAARGHA
jgi:hypothetical protein